MDSLQPSFQEKRLPQKSERRVNPVVYTCHFTRWEARVIEDGARYIAAKGGPDAVGTSAIATFCGKMISGRWPAHKQHMAEQYAAGDAAALIFENLPALADDAIPSSLPDMETLETTPETLYLASRSQVVLAAINETALAYDVENQGKITRLVANFKGGGVSKINGEEQNKVPGLSSHHGVSLGAHTEAPYYATVNPSNGHSPAPSTLILTARYNPADEATTIFPTRSILEKLDGVSSLGLSLPVFGFGRSDSFTLESEDSPHNVPVIDVLPNGRLAMRFNDYRIFLEPNAPALAKQALVEFRRQLARCNPVKVNLQPTRAVAINNYAALHARDAVRDNRRLLIRLFGYASDAKYLPISTDPLVVRG